MFVVMDILQVYRQNSKNYVNAQGKDRDGNIVSLTGFPTDLDEIKPLTKLLVDVKVSVDEGVA